MKLQGMNKIKLYDRWCRNRNNFPANRTEEQESGPSDGIDEATGVRE